MTAPSATLRARKRRDEKPFALLFPSLAEVERECEVSPLEAARARLAGIADRAAPPPRVSESSIAPSVAPCNPYLGVMLPYTPLHHLLMRDIGRPVVATSGNLTDEPICIDEHEALERLRGIADLLLVHNRPIVRHVDDSIVQVGLGREMVLRRARGYAPLPVQLSEPVPPTLAVGAHLKNAVGITVGRSVFLSQHIGDLETAGAADAFEQVIAAFRDLYRVEPAHGRRRSPSRLLLDQVRRSPRCAGQRMCSTTSRTWRRAWRRTSSTTRCWASRGTALDTAPMGRSGAASFSCRAAAPSIGSRRCVPSACRVASALFKNRGERASACCTRSSATICWTRTDLAPVAAFDESERRIIAQMLDRRVNSPVTTSAGRLFDAVASLCGCCHVTSFEGQAAMALEFAVDERAEGSYPILLTNGAAPLITLDWRPAIEALLDDRRRGVAIGTMALRFHKGLVAAIVDVATRVGLERVVLTGGCFQNRVLLEHAVHRLEEEGFRCVLAPARPDQRRRHRARPGCRGGAARADARTRRR